MPRSQPRRPEAESQSVGHPACSLLADLPEAQANEVQGRRGRTGGEGTMKENRQDRKFGAGHVGKGNLIDKWVNLERRQALLPTSISSWYLQDWSPLRQTFNGHPFVQTQWQCPSLWQSPLMADLHGAGLHLL